MGELYDTRDLVFTWLGGLPAHGTTITKQLQTILAREGLPRIRFHDLRQTAVSLMLEQGVPLTTISDVVGHSDFTLTKNVYAHLAQSLRTDAADKMTAWFDAAVLGSTDGASTRVSTHVREQTG